MTDTTTERTVLGDDFHPYRYPVPTEYTADIMATETEKWAVLATIGIDRPTDENVSPLDAWRDAVADASGIPRADLDPGQGGVLDLGFSPAYVRRFVFYLA